MVFRYRRSLLALGAVCKLIDRNLGGAELREVFLLLPTFAPLSQYLS